MPLRLLYAGTLGRKHNPLLLVELIDRLRERGIDAELTVISEGEGAGLLAQAATERPAITDFVRVMPFQPPEGLSQVLSCGDVLVALLEPGASKFSIPSKVLSYLAAGRPVLGIMPSDNPAAIDIEEAGGYVVRPDHDGSGRCCRMGRVAEQLIRSHDRARYHGAGHGGPSGSASRGSPRGSSRLSNAQAPSLMRSRL